MGDENKSGTEKFAETLGLEKKISLGDDVDKTQFFDGAYETLSGISKMVDSFLGEGSFVDTALEFAQED